MSNTERIPLRDLVRKQSLNELTYSDSVVSQDEEAMAIIQEADDALLHLGYECLYGQGVMVLKKTDEDIERDLELVKHADLVLEGQVSKHFVTLEVRDYYEKMMEPFGDDVAYDSHNSYVTAVLNAVLDHRCGTEVGYCPFCRETVRMNDAVQVEEMTPHPKGPKYFRPRWKAAHRSCAYNQFSKPILPVREYQEEER